MTDSPTLLCPCGNPWTSCDPGSAPIARRYLGVTIKTRGRPMRLWCAGCDPLRQVRPTRPKRRKVTA